MSETADPVGPGRAASRLSGAIAAAAVLFVPLTVFLALGFRPADDALRHVAKVLSGKTWSEILVLREGVALDQHPGWHALLGVVHAAVGLSPDALLGVSIVASFGLFHAAGLVRRPRPEAWLGAALALNLVAPHLSERLLLGRPFAISMAVLVVLLRSWGPRRDDGASAGRLVATVALFALATWVHGAWYLFALPVAAFALAGRTRDSLTLGGCWLAGSALGALATGEPITYLAQHARHVFAAILGSGLPPELRVGEFLPFDGAYPVVFLVALALLFRSRRDGRLADVARDPVFVLAVLGWLLAFRVQRFWLDWSLPALAVWLAFETERALEGTRWTNARRTFLACGLAAAFALSSTADFGARFSSHRAAEALSRDVPAHAALLPGPGGILYANEMRIFYPTFYANPDAPWRYAVGYEPVLMPEADLATYRAIRAEPQRTESFAPWIAKMTAADRLFLVTRQRPNLSPLEWARAGERLWVGRLPQTETPRDGAP